MDVDYELASQREWDPAEQQCIIMSKVLEFSEWRLNQHNQKPKFNHKQLYNIIWTTMKISNHLIQRKGICISVILLFVPLKPETDQQHDHDWTTKLYALYINHQLLVFLKIQIRRLMLTRKPRSQKDTFFFEREKNDTLVPQFKFEIRR